MEATPRELLVLMAPLTRNKSSEPRKETSSSPDSSPSSDNSRQSPLLPFIPGIVSKRDACPT